MAKYGSYNITTFPITNIPSISTGGDRYGEPEPPVSDQASIEQQLEQFFGSAQDQAGKYFATGDNTRWRPGTGSDTAIQDYQDLMRAIAMGKSSIPNVIEEAQLYDFDSTYQQGAFRPKTSFKPSPDGKTLVVDKIESTADQLLEQGFIQSLGDGKYGLTLHGMSSVAAHDIRAISTYRKQERQKIETEKAAVQNQAGSGGTTTGVSRTRNPDGTLTNTGRGQSHTEIDAINKAKEEAASGKGDPGGTGQHPTGNTGDSEEGRNAIRLNQDYLKELDKNYEELAKERADPNTTPERRKEIDADIAELDKERERTNNIIGNIKEGKFGIDDLKDVISAVGAGVSIWDAFKGTDDINIDIGQQLKDNLAALTDPDLRADMKQAQYEDQPEYGYMDQLAKYGEMFGDPTVEVFGDDQHGTRMTNEFNQARLQDPDLTKEQFLRDWMRQNPNDPLAGELNQKFSAMGQIERATKEYGQIGRDETVANVDAAMKFYQPKDAGGYGFTAEGLRAPDVQKSVDYALGRAFGKEATDLRQRRYEEFQKGGVLGEETLSDLQQSAFKGVDPSLQAQTKFGGGGLAKALLGTEMATRERRREGEGDLLQVLQAERAYAPALSGIMQASTPDPLTVMGVNAVSPGAGSDVYARSGQQGTAMYDPTGAYSASSQQQALMAEMFNQQYGPNLGEQIGDIAEGMGSMKDSIDDLLGNA